MSDLTSNGDLRSSEKYFDTKKKKHFSFPGDTQELRTAGWESVGCWCVCYLLSGRYITVYHMSTFVTYDFEIDCCSEKEFF